MPHAAPSHRPSAAPGPTSRHPALLPHCSAVGFSAADVAFSLRLSRMQAAARYDLSALRLGGIAPPTLPPAKPPPATATWPAWMRASATRT